MASSVSQDSAPPLSHPLDVESISGSDRESSHESFSPSTAHKKFSPYFKANPLTLNAEGRCSRFVLDRECRSHGEGRFSIFKFPPDVFEGIVRSTTVIHETKSSEV
jgi:hypothetical protein